MLFLVFEMSLYKCMHMWHSQILGSLEAKNSTYLFVNKKYCFVIGITKDILPDDKKCKKKFKKWLKMPFFAATFKINFSSHLTWQRFSDFSLNSAIFSAAHQVSNIFLENICFISNPDSIVHILDGMKINFVCYILQYIMIYSI